MYKFGVEEQEPGWKDKLGNPVSADGIEAMRLDEVTTKAGIKVKRGKTRVLGTPVMSS